MKRRWAYLVVGVVVAGSGVWLAFGPYQLRALATEDRVKRNIRAASAVTIIDVCPLGDGPYEIRRESITGREAISHLVGMLLRETRRSSDPLGGKCFEGWERNHSVGLWPRVVFETAAGDTETVWLPMCDCQVWPARLPWGWAGSGHLFAAEIHRLLDRYPVLHSGASVVQRLAKQGWRVVPLMEYAPELWRGSYGEDWHPSCAEGDFNGDGHWDYAAILHRAGVVRIVAVHGSGAECEEEVFDLPASRYRGRFQRGEEGRTARLRVRKRGPVEYRLKKGEEKTGRLDLAHDGIELIFMGRTAALYYWTGSEYAMVQTAD